MDPNFASRNGDLSTLLEYYRADLFSRLKCHDVGVIQSFDVVTQTATISMAYKAQTIYQNEAKQAVAESSILVQCPIMIASGGKARMTFPITKGDQCLVCYNDKDLQNWFAYGTDNLLLMDSSHSYSNAIAIVGVFPLNKSLANYSADRAEFSYEDTKISIKDKVRIKNTDENLFTLLTDILAAFDSTFMCGVYALSPTTALKFNDPVTGFNARLAKLMET